MNIKKYTYYYFIGIGGIGMSALARYFKLMGKNVLGYDKTPTKLTEKLMEEGMLIHFSDNVENIPSEITKENTVVIYTPAVFKTHTELVYFQENGFGVFKRSEVLGLITKSTTCLAVAGTHGKTTTSSLLGHIIKVADLKSTAFIGGIVENYNSNMIFNGDEISVVEADEFDRSFLRLSPDIACITSTDADHLDIYGKKEELEKSFKEFGNIVSQKLFVQKDIDIPNALKYAVEEEADYFADNIQLEDGFFTFDLTYPKGKINHIKMTLPGRHNIENAVAAIAMSMEIGVTETQVKEALASFKGIKRRFSRHVAQDGKVIIDDYAHHPTELNAIIRATENFYPNQSILGVFQPHLYSRTRDFADDFTKSLAKLENLILIDIYPAREEPLEGVTSEWLADKIEKINGNRPVVVSLENAYNKILAHTTDIILLMGAGNIDTLYEPLKTNFA